MRGGDQVRGFGEEKPTSESRASQSVWRYFNLEQKCSNKTQPNPAQPNPHRLSSSSCLPFSCASMRLQIFSWPAEGADAPCLSLFCAHPIHSTGRRAHWPILTAGRTLETNHRVHNYYFTGKGLSHTLKLCPTEGSRTQFPRVQLPSLER